MIFDDFPGLEMKFLNFMTFQVFHDLYKPCLTFSLTISMKQPLHFALKICEELVCLPKLTAYSCNES